MPYLWLDDESYGQLKKLAAFNKRKLIAEIRMMLEARLAGIVSQPNASVTVEEAEGLSLMDTLGEEEDRASDPRSTAPATRGQEGKPTMQADIQLLADRLIIHEEEVLNAE